MSEETAVTVREGQTLAKRELSQAERLELLSITGMPGWNVLLDLMEMECIKQETELINAPEEDEKKILALHKMAKEAWRFFVRMQKQVQLEVEAGIATAELQKPRRPVPEVSAEEILDPTKRPEEL
jgi:hypothetical protein